MMNRRWFFTTAGSAFLTAACTVVQQQGSGVATPSPGPRDDHFEELLTNFYRGMDMQLADFASNLPEDRLPRIRSNQVARFDAHLRRIYKPRFDRRVEKGELPEEKKQLRLDQACVLGQLTILAFRHEVGAVDDEGSFEKPDPLPHLGEKHLQWARDAYGFYTNSSPRVKKRHRIQICGEPARAGIEIDEPCPFCTL